MGKSVYTELGFIGISKLQQNITLVARLQIKGCNWL
jgi:hypothetical protein